MKILKVPNPFNSPVYHEETVSSTMDVSRKLASDGAIHGTVICADFQETGRGRGLKRSWEMNSGENLPFTILLKFDGTENIPSALTLRAGLAVSIAIEEAVPSLKNKVMVKWPNDILIGNKKVCGILCEADVHGGAGFSNVHVGIGINVMQKEFAPHLQKKATSIFLEADSKDQKIIDIFFLLEKILLRIYNELENTNNDWKNRLEQRLYKKGEEVVFIDGEADSGKEIKGFLTGINENGELLVTPEGAQEPQAFITGELKTLLSSL